MEKELNEIITIIQSHKDKAYQKINEELVLMYFEIGKYLSTKIKAEKWGSKTIKSISNNLMKTYPNLKGFNRAGLYRMVQFYEEYRDNVIVSALSRQISWNNNLLILRTSKTIDENEFYIVMTTRTPGGTVLWNTWTQCNCVNTADTNLE